MPILNGYFFQAEEESISKLFGEVNADSETTGFELAAEIGRTEGEDKCNKVFSHCTLSYDKLMSLTQTATAREEQN